LLRGINLGRSRRLGMADLRKLLAELDYEDVTTHLQSGNIVLTSALGPRQLERKLGEQIAERLGLETDVIVRTRDELADVVARDPLGDVVDNPARYQVTFLAAKPAPSVVKKLRAADLGRERLVVSGREIYVWHAGGIQRSPAAKLLSPRKLGVASTARNWNTITRLLELADV